MKYTLLIQNTTTKKSYSWILDDLAPTSVYHKFGVNLDEDTKDGEYEYLLIKNPDELEIEININNIFSSKLIGGETEIEGFGLLKIGDSKKETIQYDKTQKYITYGG